MQQVMPRELNHIEITSYVTLRDIPVQQYGIFKALYDNLLNRN